jgi:C2 domain
MDFKQFSAWKKPPPKRLGTWKIRCYIYQCKDLPAADSEGTSDPFIEIWTYDKKKTCTPVVEDNCNPMFLSCLEVYYDYLELTDAPPLVLNIWDRDTGILEGDDDFIGRAVIFLPESTYSKSDDIPAEPKWHKVTMGFNEGEPSIGEILCSFSIVESDHVFKIPCEYLKLSEYMNFKEFNIEINVLGLRTLQSYGLLPVKKPFVKFNIRSLLPPEKAKAV